MRCRTATARIKQTEWTYALMIIISQALGVNCTYCHNTRSFAEWDASTPQRTTAWYGIRMVRDLNNNYCAADGALPAAAAGDSRRCAEGQLRDLPPGRLQAALRREHGEGLPELSGAASPSTGFRPLAGYAARRRGKKKKKAPPTAGLLGQR